MAPSLTPPDDRELDGLLAYWDAANYLTVAQIYLQDNPLLREPLRPEHIKPRLLGHWGTSPGLSLVWTHLNRLIRATGQETLYVCGPGHGGPAIVANVYLEGRWSELYPDVSEDVDGLRRLVRQFSTPGGIPSHVSIDVPGSIHEGGELGYALVHAFGAAFDNPDLLVACVIGDGEAETAPLEGAWKGVRFLNPARDGAVLPILHLNEHKISGPTVLGRAPDEELTALLRGHGYDPVFVTGSDPRAVHRDFAVALCTSHDAIRAAQRAAREDGVTTRPRWPAIVLRTPKGWTGPHEVDGTPVEGTFRSHQVPLAGVREHPEHLAQLEAWMLGYRPDERFDEAGRLVPELAELTPDGDLRMGATPHGDGGRVLEPLDLPDPAAYAIDVERPATERAESTRRLGAVLRDLYDRDRQRERGHFRLFCPDETNSNRLGAVFEVEDRCLMDARPDDASVSPGGRVMEVLSEHNCQGWLEGYLLSGRHGIFATYEAFAMVSASMAIQHAKWLEAAARLDWRAPVGSLNVLLTSTAWRNDHNGFSHQGPGLIDSMISLSGAVVRVYLPPDANTLLTVADHCLRSRNYVNLIVIDKQPQLQYLPFDEACRHAEAGASTWAWAGTEADGEEPDVVLACVGDIPTQETLAAADLLRRGTPDLRVRVVNVVDLMGILPPDVHPHGMPDERFDALFTRDADVVMAFHGYARAVHQLLHGRPRPERFHVRGYSEQGTTTTPFDMVVLNDMSRFHLALEALRRARRPVDGAERLAEECRTMLERHHGYVREHLEDMPEVRDWTWTA